MLQVQVDLHPSKETYKSRISFIRDNELICIEHFSQAGDLLSEVRMTYEEALKYSRLINDVCDQAFGVD